MRQSIMQLVCYSRATFSVYVLQLWHHYIACGT